MKRFLTIIAILFVTGACITAYSYNRQIYLPGQLINGINVGCMNHAGIVDYLWKDLPKEVTVDTFSDSIKLKCDFVELVDDSEFKHKSFVSWLKAEPIDKALYSVNEGALESQFKELVSETKDARIECTEGVYVLVPEVYGFEYSKTFRNDFVSSYITGGTNFDAKPYFNKPTVIASDLESDFAKVSWLNDFKIEYDSGYYISGKQLSRYVNNYTLELNEEFYNNLYNDLKFIYDTTDTIAMFKTTSGDMIELPYATYGFYLDKDAESADVKSIIDSKESVTRRVPKLKGYDNLKDTYVEVSISDQHLWYYVDGSLVMETDIVTGTKGRNDTPTGIYFISERIDGKYLRGADYVTWVDKWMRITNRGHGLHDATWRSRFGDDIYTYDGSHGCINLPKQFAYDLFNEVRVGTPVIIY